MKKLPIHQVKTQLSAAVAEAESGQTIVITRHNRAVATLTAAGSEHTRIGRHIGRSGLKPLLTRATRGRYLVAILDDRRSGHES